MTSIALESKVCEVVNYRGERRFDNTPIVVVTRINLWSAAYHAGRYLHDWRSLNRQPDDILSPEMQREQDQWEESRLAVFNGWCLPSVATQSITPDKWYVLFDEATTPLVEKEIEYLSQYQWIHPLRVPRKFGFANFSGFMTDQIKTDFPKYDRILTFRLDSDDSIGGWFFEANEGFLDIADKKGWSKDSFFINDTFGVLRENNDARAFLNTTAFVFSVSTRSTPLISPFGAHKNLKEDELCIEVLTERPMWCQHVHGSSIGFINPARFHFRTDFSSLAHLFSLHRPANQTLPIPFPSDLPLPPYPWLEV